jgi:hypothetical protein
MPQAFSKNALAGDREFRMEWDLPTFLVPGSQVMDPDNQRTSLCSVIVLPLEFETDPLTGRGYLNGKAVVKATVVLLLDDADSVTPDQIVAMAIQHGRLTEADRIGPDES